MKYYQTQDYRQKLNLAYQQLTLSYEPTAFITLATNSQCSLYEFRKLAKRFFGKLDRKRLGKNYYHKTNDERIDGILTVEKVEINTHAHGALRIPLIEIIHLVEPSNAIWKKLCPAGSVKLTLMSERTNRTNYMGKEQPFLRNYNFGEQIILLSEFHSIA